MGPRAVQVFWGDEPQVQSESDFLAQLESDLVASDLKALVLVNFFAGKGSRQVDFLIVTDGHVCHVELKNYMDALEGSRNGPWQSRRADGTRHVIDRQNPYAQALACKMALSDDMSSAAGREPGIPRPPGGKRFFTQFDSVVCVFPRLADGSDVPSDYKVQTLGYREFFAFLASPGRHPGWSPLHWETFIRDLGLVNAAGQGTEAVLQTTAGALAAEYRQRFDAFHQSGLHELVPLPVLYDGADVPPARLPGVVEAAGHLQVIGPSGCGKSHLLRHSLLAMGEHVLPVIVDAGMYEGRLSVLIERSVARFTTGGTRALLRAAAINGQHVLLAVDGFNECLERFREALAGDMSAFCLQTGAWTIITTQVRVTLPPGLASAEAHSADLTDTDRRAVLASYGAEDILPLCGTFTTPYELSVAAECAAELHGPVTRGVLFTSFIRKRLSRTRTPAAVRDIARQLALAMSRSLTTWLQIDEVWRISEEHLARQESSIGVIDEVLACTLTRTSQGRLSFTHEFLGRFLTLEALRRDHPDPVSLARELRLPRYGDLAQLAVELETDSERLVVLLNSLADHHAYTAALRGEAGRAAERAARDAASGLLARTTSGLADTTFTILGDFEATVTGGCELTEGDRALIKAIGKVVADGQFTAEIGALLDATDAACQRSADKQQRASGRRPGASLIVSAVLDPSITTPDRSRIAAYVLLGAAYMAWPAGRMHRPGAEPRADIRVISALLEGATPRSHGRLLLLCYLLQAAGSLEAAALVPRVLRLCWASKAYHIRLDSLAMTRSFAAAVEGQPVEGSASQGIVRADLHCHPLAPGMPGRAFAMGTVRSPWPLASASGRPAVTSGAR
jgi:Nuclease-related domain